MSPFMSESTRPLLRRLLHSTCPKPYPPLTTPSLRDAGPLACRLGSRSVLRLRGPDVARFLQSLLTNDVLPLASTPPSDSGAHYIPTPNAPARGPPPPLYAALLTPQGRFLYDLFLYRPPPADQRLDRTGSGPADGRPDRDEELELLADVDADVADELMGVLNK